MRAETWRDVLAELARNASAIDGPTVPALRELLAIVEPLIGTDDMAPIRARAIVGALQALTMRVVVVAFADLPTDGWRRSVALDPHIVLGEEEGA